MSTRHVPAAESVTGHDITFVSDFAVDDGFGNQYFNSVPSLAANVYFQSGAIEAFGLDHTTFLNQWEYRCGEVH